MQTDADIIQPTASKKRAGNELTAKGAKSRGNLIAAALRIIVREGPGAVTHRTVAAEADASHGLVVYYFGRREELIQAALDLVARRNIDALTAAWEAQGRVSTEPTELARMIASHSVKQMVEDREMGITIMELHLAAARYPQLRESVRAWGRAYARISCETFARLGSEDAAADSALLTNLINGLVIGQLAVPRKRFEADVLKPAVERFLRTVVGGSRGEGGETASGK